MNSITKVTSENQEKKAEQALNKKERITTLDNQGRFSTGHTSKPENVLGEIDLQRGGIGKPFLKEKLLRAIRY